MPIEFSCEQCGRTLQAGEATPGSRVLCPACGAFSTVPGPQSDRQDDRPPPESEGEPPKPPPAPPAAEPGSPFAPRPVDPEDAENPYLAPSEYGPPPRPMPYGGPVRQTDAKAVVSLVLGISGYLLFCCCPMLGAPVGLVGLMLGIMALKGENRGMAIAGSILCGIQLALALAYVLFFALAVFMSGSQGPWRGW